VTPPPPSACRSQGADQSHKKKALERPLSKKTSTPEPNRSNGPTTGPEPIYNKENYIMIRKLLLMLTPVLVLAAFSVMPAFAQAETKAYGTCSPGEPQELLHCPEGEKTFTAFANETPVKVLGKKAIGSGNFILTDTVNGAKVECEGLINSGKVENKGTPAVGNSTETLVFHHCSTKVETLKCRVNTAGAGAGVIVGIVTTKVITETTVKATVTSGFAIVFSGPPHAGCPAAGTVVGTVTGSATGTQAAGSNELVFTAATGLKLASEAATITGSDETYTREEGKPVVIN